MATVVEEIGGETNVTAYLEIKNNMWFGNGTLNDRLAAGIFHSFLPLSVYASQVHQIL